MSVRSVGTKGATRSAAEKPPSSHIQSSMWVLRQLILMESPRDPDRESIGQNVMYWIDHVNRHLGMMEAMKGQLGLTGSAT